MARPVGFALVLSVVPGALIAPAFAQAPAQEQLQPGDRPLPAPDFLPERRALDLGLPPVPPAPPRSPLSSGPTFTLRGVRTSGNSAISDDELRAVAAGYLNRAVSTADLEAIRQALSRYYVDRGYINSGAVLPDQEVEDGVVTFEIVEGRLSEIFVSGNRRLRDAYIARRLALAGGPPLDVNSLRERIQFLLDDPSIERIRANIEPGAEPGESRLRVEIEETDPLSLSFTFDNNRAASIGELQAGVHARVQNFAGFGEALALSYWYTEGLHEVSTQLNAPITPFDTSVFVRAQAAKSEVVEEPFNEINVESESQEYTLGIRQPLYRALGRELAAELSLSYRQSTTFALGSRFAFVDGVRKGRSEVTVIRGALEWTSRDRDHVLAARSVFSGGVDLLGATGNPPPLPDGQFFAWLGQIQWARRLDDEGMQIIARADVQLSADPLLPLEKFGIGGAHSVRGYPQNQLVRDNGWVVSIEGRLPTVRLAVPGLSKSSVDGFVSFAPFFDYGRSWNKGVPTRGPDTLASVGAGLRWHVSDRVQANVYFAHALKDVPAPVESSLQSDGIHFSLAFSP